MISLSMICFIPEKVGNLVEKVGSLVFAPSSLQDFPNVKLKVCIFLLFAKKPANCRYTEVINHVPNSWHITVVEFDLQYLDPC